MDTLSSLSPGLPPEQQSIRDKCFHPTGNFIEFKKEAIGQSIPERFEEQVRQYPDRLAVKTRHQEFTYDELNKVANQLAHAILAQRGEGQEPISLLFEKGAPMIAAILGVLKAGKIYVPLDPGYPRARTAYILENSQVGLIVTDCYNRSLAEGLAEGSLPVLSIDEVDGTTPTENLGRSVDPDMPCWIIYTSGSTGQPKGVIQTHRNVLHFVMNYTNNFHISAEDRLTLLFNSSVNGGSHDIFTALLTGASLFPFDIREEGLTGLADWLINEEITSYHSVPTVFRHFADTLTGTKQFPKVRLVRLIGEPVYKKDVDLYRKHFTGDCIFVNRLGSTETGSILFNLIDKDTQITENNVAVGYAVEGNQTLLLDDTGKELGYNQIGEIAVKSHYLSPGYWGRPDLTDAAFLPDPKGGEDRIYLMGDLGYMLPDGRVVCLGRKDFQVKIRGYRVEVAEIEMALLDFTEIKEAVVLAREDHNGEQRLVAYLVVDQEPTTTISELRSFLKEELPDYMVPSAFGFLDALPLLPNGKVDRRALLEFDKARYNFRDFVRPQTPMESLVAKVWQDVLGVDHAGVHDNFFDLGGHSLLAMKAIAKLEKAVGSHINPRELVYQSLGQLAAGWGERMLQAQPNRPEGIIKKLGKRVMVRKESTGKG